MNKSWLWSQNSLRQSCNVFVFTFIKHTCASVGMFCLLEKCLVEKVINHIVLIRKIKFNLKQVN